MRLVGALGGHEPGHDHDDVRLRRRGPGLVEVGQVVGDRDLAQPRRGPEGVQHVLQAVQGTDGVERVHLRAAAPAQAGLVDVGGLPEHGDAAHLRIQRQDAAVVLQQHRDLLADPPGDLPVGPGVDLPGGVGALELAEAEHLRVAAHQRPVDGLDLQGRVGERGLDVGLVEPLGVGHLVVHPGVERGGRRAGGPEVGLQVALEAPLLAQHRVQQVAVLGGVGAAHPVVGAHDRRDLRVLDDHLERQQVQLPQRALVELDVRAEALVLLVVDRVVLGHRDHAVLLDGLGDLDAHHAAQVRVLGEVLEVAPGDRRAVQAHAGALEHVLAEGRGLRADDRAVLAGQARVEPGGQADGHGQGGGRRGRGAVAHAHAHGAVGDAEARDAQLLDALDVALDADLGGELVHLLGTRRAVGQRVDVDGLHRAVQLGDLLLRRHGGDQGLRPLPRGQGGVQPGALRGGGRGGGVGHGVLLCSATAGSSTAQSRPGAPVRPGVPGSCPAGADTAHHCPGPACRPRTHLTRRDRARRRRRTPGARSRPAAAGRRRRRAGGPAPRRSRAP